MGLTLRRLNGSWIIAAAKIERLGRVLESVDGLGSAFRRISNAIERASRLVHLVHLQFMRQHDG